MDDKSTQIKNIQSILGVASDGIWGPLSQAAFNALISSSPSPSQAPLGPPSDPNSAFWHAVKATSFADPADVAAFRAAKQRGLSDEQAFALGDNGIGCWGDDTTVDVNYCAVPPDDMIEQWGSESAAKHKRIQVNIGNSTIECILGDTMPWKKNITNGAGIDLNPASVAALGQKAPLYAPAMWRWA